jgi:hypothetical protein
MAKARRAPSLPSLKCLDTQADPDDAKAGAVVSGTFRELVDALDEQHWRARRLQQEPPQQQQRRPAKPELALEPEPAELLVPVETLERSAPAWPQHPPEVAPRIRPASAPHGKIPKLARLVTLEIADPDYAGAAAQVIVPPPGASTNGPTEWQTPERRRVRVAAWADLLNLMHARGQLDDASFNAGRAYQRFFEECELAGMPSVDLSTPRISVRVLAGDFVRVDARRQAAHRLHQLDAEILAQFGVTGLQLVRDVLGRALTIEACSAHRGDHDRASLRFWGSLLRRCVRSLAVLLGSQSPARLRERAARPAERLVDKRSQRRHLVRVRPGARANIQGNRRRWPIFIRSARAPRTSCRETPRRAR